LSDSEAAVPALLQKFAAKGAKRKAS
jgi:hypothetical protein